MKFTYIGNGIDAVVVDNFYTEEQASIILSNCINLSENFTTPDKTAGATSNGSIIKSNSGVFVDEFPLNSQILKSKHFTDELIKQCSFYKVFRELKEIKTLISLYGDGDYYDKHIDDSIFTVVVYVFKKPKTYSGGEIILHSCYNEISSTITPINGRAVIFPSCTPHEVTKVQGVGRFCISHFVR